MLYFITLLIFAIIPGIIFFIYFKEKRKQMIYSVGVLLIIGIIWDNIGVKLKFWTLHDVHYWFLGLPIEEYLFIIFLPLTVIGVYELINKKLKKK